ncbi:uncharacterized protein LOC141629338 [Silene latifolia]|uniref:uncharacterized protein LOC141629338 n=1 Tax=Silene latifolia TaxID=37657 RepID=UPI003D76A558
MLIRPFTNAIATVALPKGFSVPTMTLFDGTSDPCDHVSQYKQKMMVTAATGSSKEACMCKGFGSTVSGAALQWFIRLPNKSISSFTDLVNAFNQQFTNNRRTPKQPSDLYKIVRKGSLDHLLSRGGKQDKREIANQMLPSAPPICTKIINVITGGSELSGLTYSAAKRQATEGNELEQHHDALTITLSIGNCTVKKVLVDIGCSVNLIMFETVKIMGFNKENLVRKSVPLVGFSGETAHSLGEITIPTYIKGVNKLVRYLVIEGPTTYNFILGRPWLHQMKAIP